MKTITIKILAQDILTTDYTESQQCAMTRAFQRAGLNLRETGGTIDNSNNHKYISTPYELHSKVNGMYHHSSTSYYKSNCSEIQKTFDENAIEPQDFEFELELPDYML